MLLRQLALMGNTVCDACGGYAHRARDCPTNLRIGMLGASCNEWRTLIAWARKKVLAEGAERQAGLMDLPVHHQVPMVLGRKRLYA